MTTIAERLQNLNVDADALVTLEYSDGVDVFVHNETAVDTAIGETDVVSQFCELVATPGLQAEDGWGKSVESYDYKRGFCTLSTTVRVPASNFIETSPLVSGWNVSVSTENGTLTFDS